MRSTKLSLNVRRPLDRTDDSGRSHCTSTECTIQGKEGHFVPSSRSVDHDKDYSSEVILFSWLVARRFLFLLFCGVIACLQSNLPTQTRFEIALWTSCKRLPTWRDKPEPPQPASRGGLKRTPRTGNGETLSSPASTARTSNDAPPRPSDEVTGVGDGGAAGASATVEAPSEAGGGRGRGVLGGKPRPVAEMDEEDELREYLLATRQAEVRSIFPFSRAW